MGNDMTMMGWLLPETITKSITFQNFNPKIKSSTKYTYNTYTSIVIINYIPTVSDIITPINPLKI